MAGVGAEDPERKRSVAELSGGADRQTRPEDHEERLRDEGPSYCKAGGCWKMYPSTATVETLGNDIAIVKLHSRRLSLQQTRLTIQEPGLLLDLLDKLQVGSEGFNVCLRHRRGVAPLLRLELVPPVDDRQPILNRVAGHHQITLPAGEAVAGLRLVLGIQIGVRKFARAYFCLLQRRSDVAHHFSVPLPGDLCNLHAGHGLYLSAREGWRENVRDFVRVEGDDDGRGLLEVDEVLAVLSPRLGLLHHRDVLRALDGHGVVLTGPAPGVFNRVVKNLEVFASTKSTNRCGCDRLVHFDHQSCGIVKVCGICRISLLRSD